MAVIHIGDGPVPVKITVTDSNGDAIDLSAASAMSIRVRGPSSRTDTTSDADFYTDGSDGILVAEFAAETFDRRGTWRAWARFTLGAWTGSSHYVEFDVHSEGE